MNDSALTLTAGAVLLSVWFFAAWRLAVRLDNYALVDVAWALAFAPVATLYAALGDGWGPRRLLIAALVAAWSLRLGLYLWRRVARHHPAEDARYRVLRSRWQDRLAANFLGFFLGQGLLVWLLMLPVFWIARQPGVGFHPLEIAGFALWFVGLAGEGLADRQLARFKAAHRDDPHALCQDGLWAWSRHPNYFFQSLLWWGLFLAALPAPGGWSAILAPLAMLWFLIKFTGIPLTEALALEKRGDRYRDYQRNVRAFIPWPKTSPRDGKTNA